MYIIKTGSRPAMQTDYRKYTAEDFIQDDFFIRSCYDPTRSTEDFWNDLLKKGKINAAEFHMARRYLYSISVEKQQMNYQEKENVRKKIFAETIFIPKRRKYRYLQIAAACICIGICCTVLLSVFPKKNPENTLMVIASEWNDTISSGQIELIISDNKRITIAEKNAIIEHDTKGDITINEEVWRKKKEKKKKTEYNRLTVPYGNRSNVTLEDGTQLWVNAGSRIIYPTEFDNDKREIYVDGEIFLDVTHDEKRPFHVITDDIDIKVLGTSFNVLAYKADNTHSVVLVEGSVTIQCTDRQEYLLQPNDMFVKDQNHTSVTPVADVQEFISWKEGIFRFKKEKLSTILLRLARYYGVEVEVNPHAKDLECSGSLGLKQDLERVLEVLKNTAPVNYYIKSNGIYYFEYEP